MQDEESESQEQDANIEEEYKNWKQNVPFLYDIAITHKLQWPSLTVQWLPDIETDANDNQIHKLIVGTNTSGSEQNYLKIMQIILPKSIEDSMDPTLVRNIRKSQSVGELQTLHSIPHDGEVNRARYMPQGSNIIATWTPKGEIHIFNIMEQRDGPSLKLLNHQNEGYGLSWSPIQQGHLLTGGYDRQVALWNVESQSPNPVSVYKFHKKEVEDVCWHINNPNIFASCGDDCSVAIMDIRCDSPSTQFKPHEQEVNCVQFNPGHEHLFLTGSSDKTTKLFDFRKPDQELHAFEQHDEAVFALQWALHDKRYFATGSSDRRIVVCDIAKIGGEIKAEDEKDGAVEILFVHCGHQSKVNDISWNPNLPFLMASVEETTNVLQIWKMQRTVLEEEDDEEMILEELEVQIQ